MHIPLKQSLVVAISCSLLLLCEPTKRLAAQTAQPPESASQLVKQYCITCHNNKLKVAGLTLEQLDPSKAAESPEIWEKVIRKMRGHMMPPQGLPHPDSIAQSKFVESLETQLDQAAAANPNPGRPSLHRLNRTEYANAIRDLLSLNIDSSALLPPDDEAYGFDNISDALGVSPALQEHYLSAALRIGALAVGDSHTRPVGETFRVRQDLSQNQHIDGLPFGTVGGTRVEYNFPADGEYEFSGKLLRTNLNIVRGLGAKHQMEFTLDGQRVRLAAFGGAEDLASLFTRPTETSEEVDARLRFRIPVKAGRHEMTAAFLEGPEILAPERLQPYQRSSVDNFDWGGLPHLQTLTITGPYNTTGAGTTESRHKIFVCRPANTSAEPACARQITSTLAQRAYRKPVSESDLQILTGFYEAGRRDGGFEAGITTALQRILASPKFVFRIEQDPVQNAPHRIRDIELASRLSFFLWSSIPDDELLRLAAQGSLQTPTVLDRQVKRMLADPKAEALTQNFAGQWLHLRNVRNILPNSDLYPDFDDNLRQAFKRETELLFQSIVKEDRSVMDLLTADYTFLNERLARHYGVPNIYGSQFRRVAIANNQRKGLLGQGSILATTSHAERTSPVLRGKWILENILGTPVPPPPPDVPPLKEKAEGDAPKTLRAQMEEHRANPACAVCHRVMDPIGFALENFDPVGSWRSREEGGEIDASGTLADGTRVDGVAALRDALTKQPEVFAGTLTEKLLTYALGRGLMASDMPVVRRILRDSAGTHYRFSAIIMGITRSVPFQMRMPGPQGNIAQDRRTIDSGVIDVHH